MAPGPSSSGRKGRGRPAVTASPPTHEVCLICKTSGMTKENAYLVSAGLHTVIRASEEKQDGLDALLSERTSVWLHRNCRALYILPVCGRQARTAQGATSATSRRNLRSEDTIFDPQRDCLVCGKGAEVSDNKTKYPRDRRRRNPVHAVQTLNSVEVALREGITRRPQGNAWAEQVEARLNMLAGTDLPAADAKYHFNCYRDFINGVLVQTGGKSVRAGRPAGASSASSIEAFKKLCEVLEGSDECQFSFQTLEEILTENGFQPLCRKWLKKKLTEHYGDAIIITGGTGARAIVNFTGFLKDLVYDNWYKERCRNENQEKERIVRLAAQLILEEVRKVPCDMNTYPSLEEIKNVSIPKLLETFLSAMLTSKCENSEKVTRKSCALGQVLMYNCRPKSYIPPQLLALAVDLHRRYESRELIDLLNAFGLLVSYSEADRWGDNVAALAARKYEQLFQQREEENIDGGEGGVGGVEATEAAEVAEAAGVAEAVDVAEAAVDVEVAEAVQAEISGDGEISVQYVFDNVDDNKTGSLHGTNPVHWLGGIKVTTPMPPCGAPDIVPRRLSSACPRLSHARAGIPLQHYSKPRSALNGTIMKTVTSSAMSSRPAPQLGGRARTLDTLHLAGRWSHAARTPSWNGLMSRLHHDDRVRARERCRIDFTPFVTMPPSKEQTLFSALVFVSEDCVRSGVEQCFVTFDQPLYIKALEIVLSNIKLRERIVVRLGGFHLLLSFMSALGYIMRGSGLEECLERRYGPNTTANMLAGKDYARCLRAFFGVQEALATVLLDSCNIDPAIRDEVRRVHQAALDSRITVEEVLQNNAVIHLETLLEEAGERAAREGKTGKLWWRFYKYVGLIRSFRRSYKLGAWDLHLDTLAAMLPVFFAAGHVHYARAIPLHLDQMRGLTGSLQRAAQAGHFAIRPRDDAWCGDPADYTIEIRLMKPIKGRGGLARGRGFNDAVALKWALIAPTVASVSTVVEEISGLNRDWSHQHKDLGDSRQKHDNDDFEAYCQFFRQYRPFQGGDGVRNIATGKLGDAQVNCQDAEEIGRALMAKMQGKTYSNFTVQRKGKVIPLAQPTAQQAKSSSEVDDVDSTLLFIRMLKANATPDEQKRYLRYELASMPPALFDKGLMRSNKKADLVLSLNGKNAAGEDVNDSLLVADSDDPPDTECVAPGTSLPQATVIDGGFLLHAVSWPEQPTTYGKVVECYINRVATFASPVVVFDGYETRWSTKAETQAQREASRRPCAHFDFDEETEVTVKREDFLSNKKNKTALILMLRFHLKLVNNPVRTEQADADADVLIVNTALDLDGGGNQVSVVATDTDILAMLLARAPHDTNITMVRPGLCSYSIRAMRRKLGPMVDCVLVAHAMTGCDTTSALFKKGKNLLWKKLEADVELQRLATTFNEPNVDQKDIARIGEQLILTLYLKKGVKCDSLDELRYREFNVRDFPDLASFPPTKDAAALHCHRVYLQVQQWLGNDMSATDWGWHGVEGTLRPTATTLPPAPDELLHLVSCKCLRGHCRPTTNCSCRRHNRTCTPACGHCYNKGCCNQDIGDEADWEV